MTEDFARPLHTLPHSCVLRTFGEASLGMDTTLAEEVTPLMEIEAGPAARSRWSDDDEGIHHTRRLTDWC